MPMKEVVREEMSLRNKRTFGPNNIRFVSNSNFGRKGSVIISRQPPRPMVCRRRKLRDHILPVRNGRKRRRIVTAYKRAQWKRFVSNHWRRVNELYYIKYVGGNFLDCIDFMRKRNSPQPKELAALYKRYQLPGDVLPTSDLDLDSTMQEVPFRQSISVVYPPKETATIDLEPIVSESSPVPVEKQPLVKLLESPVLNMPPNKTTEEKEKSNYTQLEKPNNKQLEKRIEMQLEKPLIEKLHEDIQKQAQILVLPEVYFDSRPETPNLSQQETTTSDQQSSEKSLESTPEKHSSGRSPRKFSEKMKAEAAVVQRVIELQKEGMWYDRRLPKSYDQPRMKTHWDYLLEEMRWLAADFAVEKKWKRIAARKCARMVEKYHADKKLAEEKAIKDEKVKLIKIASFMAKEVRNFWSNVQKLVEYKEQSRIEELRKKTMDQHLSFIVDQTERISSMLAESFSNEVKPHRLALQNELVPEPVMADLDVFDDTLSKSLSDDEFLPCEDSGDDEETIALAETEAKDVRGELDLLEKESKMSIDDVLDDLPKEYVDVLLSEDKVYVKQENVSSSVESLEQKSETDYEPSGSGSDFEDTILEEEELEAAGPIGDAATELRELESDNLLSLDQLRAKYNKPIYDSEECSTGADTDPDTEIDDSGDDIEDETSDVFNDEEDRNSVEDEEQQTSLASLLQTFAPERAGEDHGDDELNSVAAMAESFQPKGYTLSSTTVATKVPPLLKHTLREYQHIGLDWMVTMYDKKLNGILADEMGLGKTIQTIALLAHLACEKENWGPHLIIVPTSVMLNWEMEFLKWFPGFKVLTYYGSIKERKLKRTGWTKPNTFHVCITSYKILIQDHQAFRRKRWKYLILDEAQNIKNFKSQRWQLLLNFSTQRRLLLTGTPLQNNLMELWSLMHFLMPNVFQSHREFREWFSNPVTGMIEGNSEYNENIIKRLHKVLRPFILRRLKCEVEKQLPQKYEHIVLCRLSKRQRFLYEDFMSRAKTKETLQQGSLLSVINVLMQLRKVCNHPNLFEPRPIISPLQTRGLTHEIPSIVWNMMDDKDEKTVSYNIWNFTKDELKLDAYSVNKIRSFISDMLSVRCPFESTALETISYDSSLCKADNLKDISEFNTSVEDTIFIQHDEDEDCSIIFERKRDPSLSRQRLYSLHKAVVPSPPRLRAPFAVFMAEFKPSEMLLQDREFIQALSFDAGSPERISPEEIPSISWNQNDIFGINQPKPQTSPPQTPSLPKRNGMSKITKLSTTSYPTKLATTPNGSEVMVTTNGVCVYPPEKPRKMNKMTNVTYASRGIKRKPVFEYESKSLLDTIVVEFEDLPESEIYQSEFDLNAAINAGSNGLDEEGSDEYEDSEEESQAPLRKLPKLEKPLKRRKRQNSVPTRVSKYTEVDEEDEYDEAETFLRKRKRSSASRNAPSKGLDLSLVEFEEVAYRKILDRKAVITNMRRVNSQRLLVHTVYGADLLSRTEWIGEIPGPYAQFEEKTHDWLGYYKMGYHEIMMIKKMKSSLDNLKHHPFSVWRHTKSLMKIIWTCEEILEMFREMLKRFMIHTPAVAAPLIQYRVFHPSVSRYSAIQSFDHELSIRMKAPLEPLRPIFSSMATQFPDPRLIQYDCGKLQVLDGLLRRLKAETHRVLIFTQMAKMLDVLEAFLNHHGYIYLRLDGATKIDQRQLLMERFNTDKRIFCFILSTRSGGIGVNLTGADTVIFYDSDWNPTMDAQAQDRCHRIGQTRDVHIYRLVSEKTVEENILKKSNQKRLLGELAIEGGNFTTAHFHKNTIHDLFDVDEGEGDATKRMAEILETPVASPVPLTTTSTETSMKKEDCSKKSATYMFESALAAAEDESDVQAARTVRAEAAAELAEFDEDIPLDEEAGEAEEPSRIEAEMEYIMNELSTVELYALRFMERTIDDWSKDTYANAQKELEQQKMEWELEHQNESNMVLGSPPELATAGEQLEDLLTYPMLPQDFWYDEVLGFEMPVYAPPTPPQDDEDVYIDRATAMLYDISRTIPDHLLPRVWQGPKKPKVVPPPVVKSTVEEVVQENSVKKGGHKVNRRDEPIFAPRSLFDRPSPALAKLRRDYKIQKLAKGSSRFPGAMSIMTGPGPPKTLGPGAITFPISLPKSAQMIYPAPTDILEWTVPEDNYLLQSMTHILELPVNLLIVNVSQTPNWDFTAEMVNSISRIHRSIRQCRLRYEQVILPREEGKYFEPMTVQKKKKLKSFIKVSPPPPPKGRRLKTSEIVANDNNTQYRTMFMKKFDTMKRLSEERPPAKNPLSQSTLRSAKPHIIFGEHNINFDAPVPASSVATARHERMLAERAKMIAAQRAHQAELAAASRAISSANQTAAQTQIQVVNSIGGGSQEPISTQGLVVNTSMNPNVLQQTPIAPVQIQTPGIIGSLAQPSRILIPAQTTQIVPQRTLIQASNSPIQIQQAPGLQRTVVSTPEMTQKGALSDSRIIVPPQSSQPLPQGTLSVPIQIHQTPPVLAQRTTGTCSEVSNTDSRILVQSTQVTQSLPQRALVSGGNMPIQIHQSSPQRSLASSPEVSHGNTEYRILLPTQPTQAHPQRTVIPGNSPIQIHQTSPPRTIGSPINPPINTLIHASVSAVPTSSSIVGTLAQPSRILLPSQPSQVLQQRTLVPGGNLPIQIHQTALPQRTNVSTPELLPNDASTSMVRVVSSPSGSVKTVPVQTTVVPTYVTRCETPSSSPEIIRAASSGAGNNIFVQLTGVPPGTKLTHAQIQQLRQSILNQQKGGGFVNVVSQPAAPQQIRLDSPNQQVKRIQIVPTTHPSIVGLVSALSLARNPTLPTSNVRQNSSATVQPPRSPLMVSQRDVIGYRGINARPPISPSTAIKPQYYTPVSQISLVRRIVPISTTTPATLTSVPVTYSAAKMSLLRQPIVTAYTAPLTGQIPSQPRQILTIPARPPTLTSASQSASTLTTATAGAYPPQLIVNAPVSNPSGVITVYTTTNSSTPASTASSTSSSPTTQS